jgi:leucyl-tRNA synthetase
MYGSTLGLLLSQYLTHGQTEKRDVLRAIEEKYQRIWQEEKVFESNAPSCSKYPLDSVPVDQLWLQRPKFFG